MSGIVSADYALTRDRTSSQFTLFPTARCGGAGGVRASSPAGETGMSEQAGADLPGARDGVGQLSVDALRSAGAGDAP